MIRLHLLGQPHLEMGEKTMLLSANHSQILAFLTMQQNPNLPMPRVRLARAIWTDCTDEQGRKRLTNSLYRLRQEHPEFEECIVADATTLTLQPIWTDTNQFMRLIHSQKAQDWFTALDYYQGDLLEDQDIPWLEIWRVELHQTMLQGLRQAIAQADSSRGIVLSQRLIQLEPWNEAAHTHLIRLYAKLGQRPEAIAVFEKLEQTLAQEFSSQPHPETRAFIADLQRQLEQPHNKPNQALVGRDQEWRVLTNALNALRVEQGGVIMLEGEAGQGKTRLLLELQSLAKWHQIPTLAGMTFGAKLSYAPLEQALQSATVLLEQSSTLIQKNLEPLLKTSVEIESSPQVISATLERWIRHLEQPTLWLLDDLHWAGDLFWTVLKMLIRMAQQRPVLLVLAARSEELLGNPKAFETLTEIRQTPQVQHYRLGGLNLEACAVLARGLGKTFNSIELEQLHRVSAGNPLVFGELVLGQPAEQHLENAFQSRFSKLDQKLQNALEAASVLGKQFDLQVWTAMLDTPAPIAQLLETRFILESPTLAFQHDLTRVFVYEQMSIKARQKWHGRAFEVCKNFQARAILLAHHAQEANLLSQSVTYYRRAAEEALGFCAYQDAQNYIQQATKNNQSLQANVLEALHLQLMQMRISFIQEPGNQSVQELETLETQTRQYQDKDLMYHTFVLKLGILAAQGKNQATLQTAESLWFWTREIRDSVLEVRALTIISVTIARSFLESDKALLYAQKAHELCQVHKIPAREQFRTLIALTNSYIRASNFESAWQTLAEAEQIFHDNPSLVIHAVQLYNIKGALALYGEHFELAVNVFQKQLDDCYTLGDGRQINTTLGNLASSLIRLGRFEEALIWAEERAERAPKAKHLLSESQVAYYFTNLAEVLLCLGRIDEANSLLDPIKSWAIAEGASFYATKTREVLALILRAKKQFVAALEILSNTEQDLTFQSELACLAGLQEKAKPLLGLALTATSPLENNHSAMCYQYTKYLIYQNPTDLELARFSLLRFACQIETLENRRVMLKNEYYAKAVEAAWQQQTLETSVVELPALSGEGTIAITWTLNSGASDKAILEQHDKVALRNHRLKRLMLEAQAQGAKALQRHLATALGVAIRTIETDFSQFKTTAQEKPLNSSSD
ncbi:MAG: hypothetical protein RLZZ156_1131 [Deinococcota bacterium]